MTLFSGLYSAVLGLWALQASLKRDWAVCKQKLRPPQLPAIRPGSIWVHAVSLGETKAIVPLVQALQKQWPDRDWIISNGTQTGHDEAKRALADAKAHLFLPIDWKCNMQRLMEQAKPSLVLLSESDLWLHFLQAARAQGAKVALINGKISERSFQRYRRFPWVSRHLFPLIDLYCCQVPLYADRFQQLGVPTERCIVTGNIKWDGTYPALTPQERDAWKQRLGLALNQQCLVVGSTHHPEETLILEAIRNIPNLKTVIVPRHSERFDEVARLIQSKGYRLGRWSQGATPGDQVVLLDTVGQLRNAYQLADLAIVAGSFTDKVGGHNILEPLAYGVPVLFGPHLDSQPGLAEMVLSSHAGLQVQPADLSSTLQTLLNSENQLKTMGQHGLQLMENNRGALARTLEALASI